MDGVEEQRELIRKLYKMKLSCGKSLLELTTYNHTAMWWMVRPMFDNVMRTKNYFPARLMRFIVFLDKIAGPLIQITLDFSIRILLRRKFTDRMREGPDKRANKTIAFLTQNIEWGDAVDVENGAHRRGDRFFHPLIREMKTRGYRIFSFYPVAVQPIRGLRVLVEKGKDWDVPHVPLEIFTNIHVCEEYLSAYKYFRRTWKTLRGDMIFNNICASYGADDRNKIVRHLELYFVFLFPYLARESRLCRYMIESEKPSAMVMTNEYGWIERSFLVSAKAEGVPVIAIQHGLIHAEHQGYIYDKDDIQCGSTNHLCCPIPDKTAVSGTYDFDLLTQVSAYPEDSVVITGQPRYDILFYAPKVYSRERFLERNSINPNHRIILWTTQSHGFSDQENQKTYECVFKTMQEIDNAILIVKQHPGEPERYTKRIMSNFRQFGDRNVVLVPKDSDIYELVFVCDLLITKTSTTAIEAAALDKPVIVLNLSEDEEPVDYVKEGIAVEVRKSDDLGTAIQRLLDDDSMLSAHRERYVADHMSRIDGESSKRVADLIVKMIP
jgi:glycosyltransferase involved in cell wall biosynthesis